MYSYDRLLLSLRLPSRGYSQRHMPKELNPESHGWKTNFFPHIPTCAYISMKPYVCVYMCKCMNIFMHVNTYAYAYGYAHTQHATEHGSRYKFNIPYLLTVLLAACNCNLWIKPVLSDECQLLKIRT